MGVIQIACGRGHWQVAQALIKAGCNVDLQDSKGETALMRCAYPATPQALKSATVLIDHGNIPPTSSIVLSSVLMLLLMSSLI
jgi:hypothetical protein